MIDTCRFIILIFTWAWRRRRVANQQVRASKEERERERGPLNNVWLMLIDNNWLLIVVHVNCWAVLLLVPSLNMWPIALCRPEYKSNGLFNIGVNANRATRKCGITKSACKFYTRPICLLFFSSVFFFTYFGTVCTQCRTRQRKKTDNSNTNFQICRHGFSSFALSVCMNRRRNYLHSSS